MNLSAGHEREVPIPITSSYVGGGPSQSQSQSSNVPLPLPLSTSNMEEHHKYSNSKEGVVKYKECLKNHAASIGGNATDGCGEFMPSGEEGTPESLMCSACNCHRNFHRKEVPQVGECHHHQQAFVGYPMIIPLGAVHTSESDEVGARARPLVAMRKRFRTKFTPEQKERMLAFAERVGWRLQKLEDSVVQHFCQEIGVKRRVLKVWMHNNNKHNLANKTTTTLSD